MSFDINKFDFTSMTQDKTNPFEEKKGYERDDRFYVLSKNDNGAGSAIVAFLPDGENNTIKEMEKINTTITFNGKRRFVSTWSPRSIKKPCPFTETSLRLYQSGDKESAKLFRCQNRYITNILIVKDPLKPENEGKVFLYEMSKTMKDKLYEALFPSKEAEALGETRKEIYNPLRGWVFKLTCKIGDNKIADYSSSSFTQLPQGKCVFGDIGEEAAQKAIDTINNKCYKLSSFDDESIYSSYDELKQKLIDLVGDDYGVRESFGLPPVASAMAHSEPAQVQINDNTSNVVVNEVQSSPVPNPDNSASDIDNLIASL